MKLLSPLVPLLVSAAAFADLGAGETPRLTELLDRLRSPSGPEAADRGAALEALLEGSPYPGSCATPLALALARSRQALPRWSRELVERLAPEGPLPDHQTLLSPAVPSPGSFRIRYTTSPDRPGSLHPDDGDLDGVPDEARRILGLLHEARLFVIEVFERSGTPIAPPDAAEAVHDVEVTDLPDRIAGWVWPDPRGPILLLDRDLALSPEGPRLLRHQIAHLLQIGLTPDESPWWYEAHAVWAEDPSGEAAGGRAEAIASYLGASRGGLEPDAIGAWEGALLWPHYLIASGSPGRILGAAWEEMAEVPGNNTIPAFEAAVTRARGASLAEEVRAFRIWNLFLGDLDDGNHYPFAAVLPGSIHDHVGSYPALIGGSEAVAPLGGFAVQLQAEPSPGGWILDFGGEAGAEWDLSIVTIPARLDAGPRLAEISLDEGRGIAAIPWREVAAVIVVVQNLGGESRGPARCSLSARHDPLVPFDLMSFTAEPESGGVALRWSTERELDLAGWMIYRSRDPLTGFTPVNSFMIPAAGGPEATSYFFLDTGLRPGRKYYYVLEGVTRHGFTEITHPSAVRLTAGPDGAR